MEKNKPKETRPNTASDARADTRGSMETADRIETMIRQMPQVKPPDRLLFSVMEAVRARKVSPWLRAYRWATSPRSISFTPLRLVSGMAGMALLALLVFPALFLHQRENLLCALGESREPVPVQFALDMPEAHSVQVAGSFNNWVPQPCELRDYNGSLRWILTLPLQPGRYEYAFLVDGKHMAHPHAELYQDDGFGNRNAVLALCIGAPLVSIEANGRDDQSIVIHAVEDARKVGVPDSTVNRLFRLAYQKGVEHTSMTNLVHLMGEAKLESLPLGPFLSKIEEGMAKHVSIASIEQVLNQKMQDYRFTRSVTTVYLKKHNLQQQATPEDLVEIAESLYSGLSRQDVSRTMEQSPAVSLSTLKKAFHLQASLKQVGFDQKLSDRIIYEGLKRNFFTPLQCDFSRTIVAGKRNGVSDTRIAEAALSVMQGGGTVTDLRSLIGVSSSDMGQYGL
jgi:hypothetical protein